MVGLAHLKPDKFPGHVMSEWKHDESRDVDHVLGAFFLMRKQVFDDVHGFDERFFVYKEDLDLSLRAKKAGWRSHYLADVQAYHKGGGTSEQIKATRLFYSLRSRTQYSFKHFGWVSSTGLLATTLMLEPLARIGWALRRGSGQEMLQTVVATSRLLVWICLTPFRWRRF
jgi:GT2 family glycosyltransferase